MSVRDLASVAAISLATVVVGAAGESRQPLIPAVDAEIASVISDGPFSDEDAIKVAAFVLERLVGSKPEGQTFRSRVTRPGQNVVEVFVCYDFGISFTGYTITFYHGAPKVAYVASIIVVPGE